MKIKWGSFSSPFGACTIAWCERGICHLGFEEVSRSGLPDSIIALWPRADWSRSLPEAKLIGATIFGPNREPPNLKLFVSGSAFQLRVWRALLQIPEGAVTTYGRIAQALRHPGASRAVGSACGNNPIALLIPCHRVIRQTGVVKGYRWGETRKRALLAWESSQRQATCPTASLF
jgi:AraC family transcriptional regulator of adaptative response/methylated-DNA-[protein]-cysteine methyltransferase